MCKIIKIILTCFISMLSFGESYNKEYDPVAFVDSISMSLLFDEFSELERIINSNIDTSNFSDDSLQNADILTDELSSSKIKDETLTTIDFANIGSISSASMIYSDGSANLIELPIGSNTEVLTVSSSLIPEWDIYTDNWMYSSPELYPDNATDNIAVGGNDAGTDAEGVISLKNGTAPTASVTNGVQLYAKDVPDTETKLLLHLNGSAGGTPTDNDETGNHTLTWYGTAQLNTTTKKFGTASAIFDGNSDYITIPDSSNWDICGSNSDNWTISFWVKHTDYNGSQVYICQYTASNNYWIIYHYSANGIKFAYNNNGTSLVNIPISSKITDNNWHHITLCKVADEYGLYKDGNQIGYDQASGTATLSANLTIGQQGTTGGYFNGNIDDVVISQFNIFSASPNSGKTDTITIPTSEYTLRTYSYLHIRDEAGNETVKSPHAFSIAPRSSNMAWSYLSSRGKKIINVDMYDFIRQVEILSGKQFIYIKEKDQ